MNQRQDSGIEFIDTVAVSGNFPEQSDAFREPGALALIHKTEQEMVDSPAMDGARGHFLEDAIFPEAHLTHLD